MKFDLCHKIEQMTFFSEDWLRKLSEGMRSSVSLGRQIFVIVNNFS